MWGDSLSGQQVGQYLIREILGMGGMGAVYRAYQQSLNREVAIKILPLTFSAQPGALERFNREARTAASLEHAHIVPIYDYGTIDGVTYVAMRLLSGGTLQQRLKAGRALPSLKETATILNQLASALDYGHNQGVIHRDIKSSNVMFDNQGSAYLVDFGIAKVLSDTAGLTATGEVVGTAAYMAPEQWRGDPVTPAADQYALAVLVYETITGRVPFEANTPHALMYKHLSEPPTPLQIWRADAPDAVKLVLERALAKRSEDRFPTVTAFAQAFEKAITGTDSAATHFFTTPLLAAPLPLPLSPSRSQPRVRPVYRRPAVWGAGALLLALVGVGLFAAFSAGRGQSAGSLTSETAATETQLPPTQVDTATPLAVIQVVPTETAASTVAAAATETLTPVPTDTSRPTETSTATPSSTPSATAAPTETLTPTVDTAAVARATYAVIQTQTAEAAAIEAELATLYARDLTATAAVWTATPSPTSTFTVTASPTSTLTSTAAPTVLPTLPPPPVIVEPSGLPAVSRNQSWTPVTQVFDGVDMVLVPPGCFTMGSSVAGIEAAFEQCEANLGRGQCQRAWFEKERPETRVCFDEPFWLDRTEVTNGAFGRASGAFASAGNSYPRESVNWFEAKAYCESRGGRLPTEAEWEYTARGPDNLIYPWGNTFVENGAVYKNNARGQTRAVGTMANSASWVGAVDISGNVREWTSTIYAPYPYNAADGREAANDPSSARVTRGGSWLVVPVSLRAADRVEVPPSTEDWNIGFRCVRPYQPGDLPDNQTVFSPTPAAPRAEAGAFTVDNLLPDCQPIVADDFTGGYSANDWFQGETERSNVTIGSGAYEITLKVPRGRQGEDAPVSWGSLRGVVFRSIRLDAIIRADDFSSGLDRTGLWLRYQDENHFLAFMIRSDGYYRIARYIAQQGANNDYTDLVDWTKSDRLHVGDGASNYLRIEVQDDQFDFYLNGEFVASVTDSTWPDGRVAFWGSSREQGTFYLDYIRLCEN